MFKDRLRILKIYRRAHLIPLEVMMYLKNLKTWDKKLRIYQRRQINKRKNKSQLRNQYHRKKPRTYQRSLNKLLRNRKNQLKRHKIYPRRLKKLLRNRKNQLKRHKIYPRGLKKLLRNQKN